MTKVTLVRHAQASFGAADYDRLSATGLTQAEHLGALLHARGERINQVWMGTMRRHRLTAETCLACSGLSLEPKPHAAFDEFDHKQVISRHTPRYADQELMVRELSQSGHPTQAFASFFLEAMNRWISGAHDADYDESWRRFKSRCLRGLDAVLANSRADDHVMVFTSGGVIAVIVQSLLGLSDAETLKVNWSLANGSLTGLRVSGGNRHLVSVNEHGHFLGPHSHLLTWR